MRKKFMTAGILIAGIFFFATIAYAEVRVYEGVGEYWITKGETMSFARQRAKEIAERDALEQIYLYVSSQSSVKNLQLDKDEIITIAAGLMYVTNTKFSVATDNGVFIAGVVVTAEIDPDEIPAAVEREKQKHLQD